jgi:hypothetical protein
VHDDANQTERERPSPTDWAPPVNILRQLTPWIDVGEVGAQRFWLWLETIIPVIPLPERGPVGPRTAAEAPEVRLRQIARNLVDCARERARLATAAARFYEDNFVLALRVKALEAGLAQLRRKRAGPTVADDEDARVAAERYLMRGR